MLREDSKKNVRSQVMERVVSDGKQTNTEEKKSGVPEKTFGIS